MDDLFTVRIWGDPEFESADGLQVLGQLTTIALAETHTFDEGMDLGIVRMALLKSRYIIEQLMANRGY